MNNLVLYFVVFIFGFLSGLFLMLIISKVQNKSLTGKLIFDFKRTIDELKFQNQTNSLELKNILSDTAKIGKIFFNNQNIKGKFGEESLENILKYCFIDSDYFKQFITKNSNGDTIKPDYIINLPNDKSIVIDCKLNLEKYFEYCEADDTTLKAIKKKELINDINATVNNLSNKKYETALNINSPDFIFMYIPIEPLINLIYTDKDFSNVVQSSYNKNIVITGNSGILTCIRLAREIWTSHIQNKNIENIIELAQEIYNLISKHSQNLLKIKNTIDEFHLEFNKEFDKFNSDSKLFKVVENLRNYGINPIVKKTSKKVESVEIDKQFLN